MRSRRRGSPSLRILPALVGLALVASAVACSDGDGARADRNEQRDRGSTSSSERATTTEPVAPLPTGLGDPLFPDLGAPGIDVEHYDVRLEVDQELVVSGTVTMTIRATAALSRVAVDARSMTVDAVELDGEGVDWELKDPELLVTPDATIEKGSEFELAVTYTDDPVIVPAGNSLGPGWVRSNGAVYTLSEPEATRDWLPSLDHPSDKATWRIAVRPPPGMAAIANGLPAAPLPERGRREPGTWVWEMPQPMATYLVQVLVGDWNLVESDPASGIELSSAVLGAVTPEQTAFIDAIDEQMEYLEDQFGPYQFDVYGAALIKDELGVALEQQGRSLFAADTTFDIVAVHELGHQWFGNAVTPARWGDIWLSESFATYAEWLWQQHTGQRTMDSLARSALIGRREEPGPPTAEPTVETLFGNNVYEGGAVVVHALRLTIGDEDFFRVLRGWVADNAGTSRTTDEFVAYAEEVSGQDLSAWERDWLRAAELPPTLPA